MWLLVALFSRASSAPCPELAMATTRQRKSSIDLLDPRIQAEVNSAIKDGRATIDEIVAMIKALGGEASRSAVGRYVRSQNVRLEKYREAQEVAKVWVDKLGSEPDGDVAKLLLEMLRVVSFQTISNMDEADPQSIFFLAQSIKNIAQADKLHVDREAAVRKLIATQVAKAAEDVTKTARKAGMSDETVDLIRSKILGIGEAKAPA